MFQSLIEICSDANALADRAAELVIRAAQDAVRERGRFTFVLAGGSTPEKSYSLLAQPERLRKIDWPKMHVFFGDERFVPAGDPASNYGMARRALLSRAPIPASQVFAMPTNGKTPAEAATAYSREMGRFFAVPPDSFPPPRFDLVLLGLGDDGHTASLFPGKPAVQITDQWVTWSPPGVLPPPVDRITMTYSLLNAVRHVAFLVVGEKKAGVVKEILEEKPGRERYPAAGIAPADGTLTWLLEERAAAQLTPRHR